MKYDLRDYQIDGSNAAVKGLREEKHPFVIVAATGAGKSLIIADVCHRINEPILILQPNKEILEQNYKKLKSYGVSDVSMYSASMKSKEIAKFTYATIGSIRKIPEKFKHFKYVIIDECHQVNPKNEMGMLTKFLKDIDCKHVVGLTATPYRLDVIWTRDKWGGLYATAGLKMINRITRTPFFKKIVFKIETAELQKRGYLVPIQYFTEKVELDELVVNTTGADFTDESMERFWNQKRLSRIAAAVKFSHENNKRTLVFCAKINQAERAMAMVRNMGISCEIVTGKTPMKERSQIVDDFRSGKVKHLFNVGVFTTGFDAPELDCIVMARPTMSLALYYQIIGRGVRLDPDNPKKILQVYDMVGVVERLGRVETIRVQKEKGGFKDEVWSEAGRMDGTELYSFKVKPKERKKRG
jgi:DNA repair protein RadD